MSSTLLGKYIGSLKSEICLQVSEARRVNGSSEKPMSGLKHVQSATSDLSGNEHHFNFMQVSSKSALLHVLGLPPLHHSYRCNTNVVHFKSPLSAFLFPSHHAADHAGQSDPATKCLCECVQDPAHDSADDPSQRSQSSDGGPPEIPASMHPQHSSRKINTGFRARGDDGPQRYCFMGRPTARVSPRTISQEVAL